MLLPYQVTCMEKMDTEVIRDASKGGGQGGGKGRVQGRVDKKGIDDITMFLIRQHSSEAEV